MFYPNFIVYVIHLITHHDAAPVQPVRTMLANLHKSGILQVPAHLHEILAAEIDKFDLDGPLDAQFRPIYLSLRLEFSKTIAGIVSQNYWIDHSVLRSLIQGEWNKIFDRVLLTLRVRQQKSRLCVLLESRAEWVANPMMQFETLDILSALAPESTRAKRQKLYEIYTNLVKRLRPNDSIS